MKNLLIAAVVVMFLFGCACAEKKSSEQVIEYDRAGDVIPDVAHTVVAGDCLWNLSRQYYYEGFLWYSIFDNNKETIGMFPDVIKVGDVLNIKMVLTDEEAAISREICREHGE
jgi:hypothetical protein